MIGERILWPFPGCAYCGGRVIFGEYVIELALKCEDCPCRMVVPNKPGYKAKLFKAWKMRIGVPSKVRIVKPGAALDLEAIEKALDAGNARAIKKEWPIYAAAFSAIHRMHRASAPASGTGREDWAKADRERFLSKLVAIRLECDNAVGSAKRKRFDQGAKWLGTRIQKLIREIAEVEAPNPKKEGGNHAEH